MSARTRPLEQGVASEKIPGDAVGPSSRKKSALLAFLFLGVIWGSNFIFMKWATEAISPAQIVLLRAVFGFLPVFIYALSRRVLRWQGIRHAHHFVVIALLATAISPGGS
jgi:drug/metabolite transporter (DMT)-like permease